MSTKAERDILKRMERLNETKSNENIRFRFQQAIKECEPKVCHARYVNDLEEVVPFELKCVHEVEAVLDTFTVQYNAIMYTLQRVCGFRARPFLLYN
jgi:uncharacterized protein YkuJ